MINQINPPFLKSIETQGYVFSHIFKCSMSQQLKGTNVYQHLTKGINQYDTLNLYPKDDRYPNIFKQLDKWIFPTGIRAIKQDEEKYNKVIQIIDQKDLVNSSTIHDYNYFTVIDPTNDKLYRCVSGIYYEKISAKGPKDKKNTNFLVPYSYCVISEYLYYHPMKQFINLLIQIQINPQFFTQQLQEMNSIYIDQIIEDDHKLEDFIIQSVFHCCEIKSQNHKMNINLTSDIKHPFLYYYNKNDLSQPFLNLICPSNSSFEHLIFNQSPNNLFYLVICLLMEYQVVITSSKQSQSTLFCENLLYLIRPLTWKGLYYPTHHNSGFNFQTCKQPFLVGISKKSEDGLERFQKHPPNRVIYDLDENSFIFKPDDIPLPVSYKNYLIKNLNFVIADLRFWEETKMTIEAEIKYKQYFYNFFLLAFHDILNYFQKGTPPPPQILTPSNQQPKTQPNQKEDKKLKEKQNSKNMNQIAETTPNPNYISLGYAYFNQEEYIKSFSAQEQPFFLKVSQTQGFRDFVEQCFKSIDFKTEFIKEMRLLETEYQFHQVFLYINDCRFLAKRLSKIQTLNDKILEIEKMQGEVILNLASKGYFPNIQIGISFFSQDYQEGLLQYRSIQDIKTTARSQASSEQQQNMYGYYQKNQKQTQPTTTAGVNVQRFIQKHNQQNQGDSFLQISYRNGLEGDETQRNNDRNPLYMCDLSQIEQGHCYSSNNLKIIDDHQFQLIFEHTPQPQHSEDERIPTICSHNDLDIITVTKKNEPNSLSLFNRKFNLENRFQQESISFSKSPQKNHSQFQNLNVNNTSQLDPQSYLGFNNLSAGGNNALINSHINSHSTLNNFEDLTTCSQRGQIVKNLSYMKFHQAESTQSNNLNGVTNNFLSNLENRSASSQQITPRNKSVSTQQKSKGNFFNNLQQGCFEMWGHYQEEGNFNIA